MESYVSIYDFNGDIFSLLNDLVAFPKDYDLWEFTSCHKELGVGATLRFNSRLYFPVLRFLVANRTQLKNLRNQVCIELNFVQENDILQNSSVLYFNSKLIMLLADCGVSVAILSDKMK
jgi:hypothetical protein